MSGSVFIQGKPTSGGNAYGALVDANGNLQVVLAAGSAIIGQIGSSGVVASASFTPAAAAYSAGDIIGTTPQQEFSFTFAASGLAVPASSLIRILSAVIKIDQTAVISGETSYSLALYSVTPPSAQADNAAWTLASADLPSYRGTLSLGTPVDLGAACYIKTQFSDLQDFNMGTSNTSMFGELITAGGFTATAVARQIILYGIVL